MPRAFSERERDAIRENLRSAARDAFRSQGLRRTNVEDLAKSAGISKGAFYLFYPSKEALMLELLLQLEEVFRLYFARKIESSPRQALRDVLVATLELRDTEPLLERVANEDGAQLVRGLDADQRTALTTKDLDFVTDFLQGLHKGGVNVAQDVTPEVMLGLLRSLFFLSLHRDKIGRDVFPRVAQIFVSSLAFALAPEA